MNFNSPILFPWWLKAIFFTRCLYFHHNWWKERGTTSNTSNIFEGCYWRKYVEIHKHNQLPIIWIFKKLNTFLKIKNYLQSKTTFWTKLSHSITRTPIALSKFFSSLCLPFDLSYWESTVADPISFHYLAS